MVNVKLSLFFVALFSIYLCVQALECYSCTDCNKPKGKAKCSTNEVCAMWTQTHNTTNSTHKMTNRGCKPRGFCQSVAHNNTIKPCYDCEKDKCNGGSGITANIATLMAATVGVMMVSRFNLKSCDL